jgi:hypothetical protein
MYLAVACLCLAIGALQSDAVAGLIISGGMALLCSPFFVRSGIYATERGLKCVPTSGRQSVNDWSTIKGFEVAPAAARLAHGFGIYVHLWTDAVVLLPTTRAPVVPAQDGRHMPGARRSSCPRTLADGARSS